MNSRGALIDNFAVSAAESVRIRRYTPFIVCVLVVFLFSLWDFYPPQLRLRVLDLAGVGVLSLWSLLAVFNTRNSLALILLTTLFLVFSGLGLAVSIDNVKPIAGVVMGVCVFCYFYSVKLDTDTALKVLNIVISIHATFLVIQFFYYYAFGTVLHLYEFIGGEKPRIFSSIFRPSGLFLEPAHYSISMAMLITIKIFILKRFDTLIFCALASIFLTLSLWGFITGLIFILIFSKKNRNVFIVASVILLTILFAFSLANLDWIMANDNPWIRLISLTEDNSGTIRYGGVLGYELLSVSAWFGKGISTDYHEFGSSGLAFLLSAGGLIGTAFVMLLFFALIQRGRRLLTLAFILLFLTAAPIWTTMFWWFCLAMVVRPLKLKLWA